MSKFQISEEKFNKYAFYCSHKGFMSTRRKQCIYLSVLLGMFKGELVDDETISHQTGIALTDVRGSVRRIPCIEKIQENGKTLYFINFQKADKLYEKARGKSS